MTSTEFLEMHRAIGRLRRCVEALSAKAGDSPATRRLTNDLDRLELDAEDVRPRPAMSAAGPAARVPAEFNAKVVRILDAPYDPALWDNADEEGIGGHRRQYR